MTSSAVENTGDSTHVLSISRWLSKLAFLSIELIGYRFRRARIAATLAIGEPVAVVAFFSLLHSVSGPERPPFGTSTPLFYATGIMPFYLFLHTSLRFRVWDYLPRFPEIREFDLAISQIVSELISKLLILILCFAPMALLGTDEAIPHYPFVCLEALVILTLLGAGIGIFNAVIAGFFFPWTYIYQVLVRGAMAFSGILVVADYMPEPLRTFATWIPMTHAVTLFRAGQYARYPVFTLSMQYLLGTTVLSILLGWLAESGTRRWRTFR